MADDTPKLKGPPPGTKTYFVLNPRTQTPEQMHAQIMAAIKASGWKPGKKVADKGRAA
jgi:hypothetical protein